VREGGREEGRKGRREGGREEGRKLVLALLVTKHLILFLIIRSTDYHLSLKAFRACLTGRGGVYLTIFCCSGFLTKASFPW
jgi:hypothetical protein